MATSAASSSREITGAQAGAGRSSSGIWIREVAASSAPEIGSARYTPALKWKAVFLNIVADFSEKLSDTAGGQMRRHEFLPRGRGR